MKTRFEVLEVLENGDLRCKSKFGYITIDVHTDRGRWGTEEFNFNVGDFFECETFPYTPLHFAKYETIEKIGLERSK